MAYKFVDNYRERGARKKLVEHLKSRGITDERVLSAIGKVPRHFFFDETFWNQAYKDIAFPIPLDKDSAISLVGRFALSIPL